MDPNQFLKDIADYTSAHKFEDLEDYIEFVTSKIEEATFYWKVLTDMFMPEMPLDIKRKLFEEFVLISNDHFDKKLKIRPCPDLEGPFTIQMQSGVFEKPVE